MKLPANYDALSAKQKRAVRERYALIQDGMCAHCGTDLEVRPKQKRRIKWRAFPPNFLKYPVHLHHEHNTGLTIGAVHAYCNAYLWQYKGE